MDPNYMDIRKKLLNNSVTAMRDQHRLLDAFSKFFTLGGFTGEAFEVSDEFGDIEIKYDPAVVPPEFIGLFQENLVFLNGTLRKMYNLVFPTTQPWEGFDVRVKLHPVTNKRS